ncbi:histidine-phosphotransfer domain, HPT domain-containing protein [Acaromyces ingoldii]|uniref:Histidine-phosphotransfer domain, HPT domain-containing protein n=1 Tax=Acaromyces ingoldii TaxID=215250 RepID=A0A316YLM4_9BASI|nr:histidine-phosphotransfer domain, HPT domain-containing protein [Acaromyces ingoldii]PWN89966.1 histidine-phosphotransfer domain, HPT domain-containing protein [Acaromyces ingoldii]
MADVEAAAAAKEQASKGTTQADVDRAAATVTPGDVNSMSPEIIDMDIFGQLLEMDDEDDREFSKEIVWNYFDQAESTFSKMDQALSKKDLPELSTLGHFLKGSSAAVGVIKVRDSCEYMQHYGKKADKDGITELSAEAALEKLTTTLEGVKIEYKEAEVALRKFYEDDEGEDGENEAEEDEE